ncbi:hypothetical protein [Bacillus pumilus]|uniref:hypothetical protein n=1 Tax=Bacillus pumilus TaxID=1408 RepID=UPI003D7637C3
MKRVHENKIILGRSGSGKGFHFFPKQHLLFHGVIGKTTKLKLCMLNDTDDFKLIINPLDEYTDEIAVLKERGYKISNGLHDEREFNDQLIKAVQKNTVLHLSLLDHDFYEKLQMLIFKMHQKAFAEKIKMNVFIDDQYQVINSMPIEVMPSEITKIHAAVSDINRLDQAKYANFIPIEC